MILTTTVKRQLLALAVATVLGALLLGNMYLRIPEALGIGRYQVTAAFTHGAQLYDGAEVTYLGRPVGKVVDLELADEGIVVSMSLVGKHPVPGNARAEIHSRSAVGEQYVDLVPAGASGGGRLADGARIPVERTSTPVEIGPLLDRVGALADSLPEKDLNVLLRETGAALRGRKDDLADLIDDSSRFLSAAEADLGPTRRLLRDFQPLAEAVVDSGSEFDNAMKDLAAVTQTIRASDPTIRRLLASTPGFARDVTALLEALRAPLPVMLRRLSSVAEPFAVYNAGFERILSDYPTLAAVAQCKARDLSTLRLAIHAAAPCPPDVKQAMIDWWGPILLEYYSSTESSGLTMVSSQEWLTKRGTVGRSMFGPVHVCDTEGVELPSGDVGRIYFERDVRPFEYHKDPEKTRQAEHPAHPNWTTVGDMGYVDEDGYVFLTDRESFMIISGGVNIYPQEVEDALTLHPAVFDVAVIGVPDPTMGEEVKAVVQLREGEAPSAELADALIAHALSRVAKYKAPKSVDFVESLPRTPTGKLVKRQLVDRYRAVAT